MILLRLNPFNSVDREGWWFECGFNYDFIGPDYLYSEDEVA